MYQQYDGLIFDMDGTLFNSEPLHRQAWRQIFARYDLRVNEQALSALNGSPTWCIAQHIIAENQTDLDAHQLAKEKNALLHTLPLDELQLLPAADIARQWYGRRPLAVGTGSDSTTASILLEHSNLHRYFKIVVCADHITHPKPAADTFLRCAELMGVAPQRCVVFEDAEFGLQAAQQAGMDAVDVRLWQ